MKVTVQKTSKTTAVVKDESGERVGSAKERDGKWIVSSPRRSGWVADWEGVVAEAQSWESQDWQVV